MTINLQISERGQTPASPPASPPASEGTYEGTVELDCNLSGGNKSSR